MTTETIEMEVDPETARRYREAAPEDRKRVAQAVSEWLGTAESTRAGLAESVRRASERARRANPGANELDEALGEHPTSVEVARLAGEMARANGLTDEVLECLLHE